jgi:hypothetical protein
MRSIHADAEERQVYGGKPQSKDVAAPVLPPLADTELAGAVSRITRPPAFSLPTTTPLATTPPAAAPTLVIFVTIVNFPTRLVGSAADADAGAATPAPPPQQRVA